MNKLFLVLFSGIVLASCTYNTIDINSQQPIRLKVNEKFRINLPEDHRTGYTWQLNNTYAASLINHTNTVWEGNTNGVFYYFKTIKPGRTVLNFSSRNYDDVNSIKEMEIIISEQ